MNTTDTGHSGANVLIYLVTMMATFLAENWYVVFMVGFGAIHAYIAVQRFILDRKKTRLEIDALENTPTVS